METTLEIKSLLLKKGELILRALNHKLRQDIIKLIHENEEVNVTDIYIKLNIEQTVVSQHLSILRKAGFVQARREGKQIFYTVNYEKLEHVQKNILSLLA
ncbi:MAG TPA: metalloregulator ArsR/SmtB family transcription factor [Flavisolibacter sp.]|nr:metalloregulator ArsR/SmtB family transcription factor [Flavisolibacter sp.]